MAQIPVDQLLQAAIRHHQAGQLPQAGQAYRQILTQVPNHPDAASPGRVGRRPGRKAGPGNRVDSTRGRGFPNQPPTYHNNHGNLLMQRTQADESLAAYRRALQLKPGYANAHNNLGNALKHQGRANEAEAAYREAIRLDRELCRRPQQTSGIFLISGRNSPPPLRACGRRLYWPDPQVALSLQDGLEGLGQKEEAIASFRQAVAASCPITRS